MNNEIPCRCGHLYIKHAKLGMGTKELITQCVECCPTDFNEHVHPFVPDNLAYLEMKDRENG